MKKNILKIKVLGLAVVAASVRHGHRAGETLRQAVQPAAYPADSTDHPHLRDRGLRGEPELF